MLVILIWLGRMTGLYDPGGREFPELGGRHLTAAGTVADRQATAGGCRIILNSISFLTDPSESYSDRIRTLNNRILPSDRMLITLTDLQTAEPQQEQTELFRQLHIGDSVVFRGRCQEPERASNPGQFDLRRYYHARNIYFIMRDVQPPEIIHSENSLREPWHRVRDILCDLRYGMLAGMTDLFGEDAPYLAAVLLGDKSGMTEEQKQLFQDGGLAFLLAVSALHITLAGKAVYLLLRKLRFSFFSAGLFSLCTALFCVLLTGGSVSSHRACVMFLFWLGAQILGRAEDRLSSLGAAVLFLLIRQPYALFDGSFQITCICILSMELIPPAVNKIRIAGLGITVFRGMALPGGMWRYRRRRKYTEPGKVRKNLTSTLCIQIGILPVILYWYYQVCPYAVILHPLMIGAASMLLAFALPGAVFGMLLQFKLSEALHFLINSAGLLLAGPCHILITLFLSVCRIEQELPFSVVITGRPHILQIVIYYILLGAFLIPIYRTSRKRLRQNIRNAGFLSITLPVLLAALICFRRRPVFRYTCLDVGQGNCSLIEYGDSAFLFDAGSSSVENVWKYRIDSTLKYYGISEVDTVFLSHGDLDHINGAEQMLGMYHRNLAGKNAGDVTIGQILLPDLPTGDEQLDPVKKLAEKWNIPVGYVSEGTILQAGQMSGPPSQSSLTLQVLSPSPQRITGSSNEDCIVLYVSFGKIRILLTGDMELEGERQFVQQYSKQSENSFSEEENDLYTILTAGHHGSKNATSEELLNLVRPDIVLISCGRNNRYGHPAEEMLERLKKYGVQWARTDLEGSITVNAG